MRRNEAKRRAIARKTTGELVTWFRQFEAKYCPMGDWLYQRDWIINERRDGSYTYRSPDHVRARKLLEATARRQQTFIDDRWAIDGVMV